MSPAMVDFTSHLQNPNPSKPPSHGPPSPLFSSRPASASTSAVNMNPNSNDPPPVCRNASTQGLCRPRLVKVRRHLGAASHRGRTARTAGSDSCFNPFCPPTDANAPIPEAQFVPDLASNPPVANASWHSNDGGIRWDSDPFRMWGEERERNSGVPNPFWASSSFKEGAKSMHNEDSRPDGNAFYGRNAAVSLDGVGFRKSGDSGFVFGRTPMNSLRASEPKNEASSSVSMNAFDAGHNFTGSGLDSGKVSDNRAFVFTGSRGKSPVLGSVEESKGALGSSFMFQTGPSVLAGAKSADNEDLRFARDQLYGNNPFSKLEGFELGKSGNLGFVFGTSQTMPARSTCNSKDETSKSKAENKSSKGLHLNSGKALETGCFVFASATNKSSGLASNSLDDRLTSKLPNEMCKLKIVSEMSSHDNENNVAFTFAPGRRVCVNVNTVGVSDAGAFVFGMRGNNSPYSAPNLADVSSVGNLPDEINKLKIGSGGTSSDTNNVNLTGGVGESRASVVGSWGNRSCESSSQLVDERLRRNLPVEMGKLNIGSGVTLQDTSDVNLRSGVTDAGAFVFGWRGDKSSDSGLNLVEENSDSNLPGEMCKLRISAESTLSNNVNFTFGMSGRVSTGASSNLGEVPAGGSSVGESSGTNPSNEMSKSKGGSGVVIQETNSAGFSYTKNESVSTKLKGEAPDVDQFVFGTSGGKSSDTAPSMAGESSKTKLSDEIRKLKIEESGKNKVDEMATNSGYRCKVDEKLSFTFGSQAKNVMGPFSEVAETALPADIRKLNIESQTGGTDANNLCFSSSATPMNDAKFQGPADGRIFIDATASSPVSPSFTFHAGVQTGNFVMEPDLSTHLKEELRPSGVSQPSPSSPCHSFHGFSNAFEQASSAPAEKSEFSFTSRREAFGQPQVDLRAPKVDASLFYKDSLFGGSQQNIETSKRGSLKDRKSKKLKGKLGRKKSTVEKSSHENPEVSSPRSYSPMDFSPYQETSVSDECSREIPVTSVESVPLRSINMPELNSMDIRDENLFAATHNPNLNEVNLTHGEQNEDSSMSLFPESSNNEGFMPEIDMTGFKTESCVAAVGMEPGISGLSLERQASDDGTVFNFSSAGGFGDTKFAFAAAPSTRGSTWAVKRNYRRKNSIKGSQDTHASSSVAKVPLASPSMPFMPEAGNFLRQGPSQCHLFPGNSSELEHGQDKKGDTFRSLSEAGWKPVSQGTVSCEAMVAAAQEACEKWRHRGNQAYGRGDLSKAEDYYTRGVNCVSPKETSRSCLRALMLCYSNRAATRMSLGRMREALDDCMMAARIEPNFLRAQVRAANCHLALGEIEDALTIFKKCLQAGCDITMDQKLRAEASNGLQKVQQVDEYMDHVTELLKRKTCSDAANALETITEALSLSPYSENFFEMKAEALLMLRKYEEVVQWCQQTLESAESNSFSNVSGGNSNVYGPESLKPSVNLWRWRLISKSYFYLGRLDEALELLLKHEHEGAIDEKDSSKAFESSGFTIILRDLLRHKAAGNEAFVAGKHAEAVEHYTAALQCSVESRPFAAICFANRAAAYQALGQIADAIADCSLAIALDSNYAKAISRRATLHGMIRDYGQAINDLQRLISLLEKQTDEKGCQSGTLVRSSSSLNDLRQARTRLNAMEGEVKKGIPLDMYLILGIEPSSNVFDVKKAYRKAALRHHPDKASQFLPRSENGDDGLWKEVAEEVHKDADKLFKMIGEAYAVISDPSKRSRYDTEEEMRFALKKDSGGGISKSQGDVHSYSYEKSSNRRQWNDPWKSYANQRWSESSRSNKYY